MSPSVIISAVALALIVGAIVAAYLSRPKLLCEPHTIAVQCEGCGAIVMHAPSEDSKAEGWIAFTCGRCGRHHTTE